MTLEDYIDSHIGAEPAHLRNLYRNTHLTRLYPRMCSDHAQGALLAMIVSMIKPRRILELGTFTGYSAIAMAEAMREGAVLDTIEVDYEYEDEIRKALATSSRANDIHLHIGDAEELIPQLCCEGQMPVDMVFIDANKRRYKAYYDLLMPLLPRGAFILADNTLWSDKILNVGDRTDPQTAGIMEFNDAVAIDERVAKAILPVRDGLTILRKL